MKSSTKRILTTHTGSLPRSKALSAMLVQRERKKPIDAAAFATELAANMDANIKRQADAGVDIGNDGETPRVGFSTYTTERMKLPDGMLFIPGVTDVTTNYLEHPELVANRICAAVAAVGDRERIIAEDVVWAKLKTLSEGAALASRRLWG